MRLVLALLLLASQARAQDDWALTRPAAVVRQPTERLATVRALVLEGLHAEAATAFEELAQEQPASRAALRREAAREWLAAGQPERAIEVLAPGDPLEREAFARAGRSAELAARDERAGRWGAAGAAWEQAGDDTRALSAYERARDDDARLRLLRKLGRALEVEQLATAMLKRAAGPAPLIALAQIRHDAGRHQEALALLAKHSGERSPPLHRALRALYNAWGERSLEERELQVLVGLEPNEPSYRLALADAALARGDRERARAEVLRAAGLDGSAAREAHAAQLLAERDLFAEALMHVALARQRAPQYRGLEASLLERAGRLGDAERAYQELLDRGHTEARRSLVGLWRRAGTLDSHTAELQTRDDLASMRMLVELYAHDPSKLTQLRALLARILAQAPDDPEAQRALARAHRDAGDLHAAIAMARALDVGEALELASAAPEDPAVPALLARLQANASASELARLAGIYRSRQELEPARSVYRRALALDPGADDVRLAAAELELSTGRPAALTSLLTQARSEAVLLRAAALLDRASARAALLAGAEQRAQRRVLLSLAEPLPSAMLRRALLEGDERERAQALAQLRERPNPALTTVLQALVARTDRPLSEREAALRALPITPALYARLPRSLRARALLRVHDPALLARERTSSDPQIRAAAALTDDQALARALFSARPGERATAAEALRHRDAWDAITRAAPDYPSELVPYGPGLAPRALVEAGMCPPRERILAFSAALVPALRDVRLLVHAGGASPESLRRLDREQLHQLLVELAGRSELPPGAAEAVLAERPLRDWPERMWATRALESADAREPLELVRAADGANPPAPRALDRCPN